MISFRTARNDDVPALADLWNRGTPGYGVARPLQPREFGDIPFGHLFFDLRGVIVAVEDGKVVGFAHSGFGPLDPAGSPHQIDPTLGTLAMLLVDPQVSDEVGEALVVRACQDLRDRGAKVIYAGGQYPVNPFYWGIYGGSEFSGVLGAHERFHRSVRALGFRTAARSVLLEADLDHHAAGGFDPRALLLRRRFTVVIEQDTSFERWWDALALGLTYATDFRLEDHKGQTVARATTWDMAGFERLDGRLRVGLIDVSVESELRRQGLGRYLIREAMRHHAARGLQALCVQTSETNAPALALYHSLGFREVEESILYRLDSP